MNTLSRECRSFRPSVAVAGPATVPSSAGIRRPPCDGLFVTSCRPALAGRPGQQVVRATQNLPSHGVGPLPWERVGTESDPPGVRPLPRRKAPPLGTAAATFFLLIIILLPVTAQTPQLALQTPLPAPTNSPLVATQIDPFSDPLIQKIEARHKKACAGDKAEAKALTTDLEKWTEEQPTNYLLQAYLGSVYTLDSRDAWIGPGKLSYLRKGGQWLDGAVASAPDNPAIRFIRAIDYYELPSFFGKAKTAREDFQILLKQIDGETKSPYILNIETQQAIYYYAGLSFKQASQQADAKEAWVLGYKLAPTSDLGKKIGDELMKVQ